MKRYTIILAVFAVTALTACGNGSTTNEKNDTSSVNVDSVKVDSTTIETSTDTSEVKEVK